MSNMIIRAFLFYGLCTNQNSGDDMRKVSAIHQLISILLIIFFTIVLLQQESLAEEYSTKAPLASKSLLLDGVSVNNKLVVVGERGHILISTDGNTWQQANVPTRSTLTAVYFIDQNNGWAVGHDTVILRTTDGGMNWDRVYYSPENETPLLDIWFRDADFGIALGAYNLYLISKDSGKTWTQKEMNIINELSQDNIQFDETSLDDDDFVDSYDLHLNSITFSDSGKLYIVAEAGRIYRSDNFGSSWKELTSPYIGSLFGSISLEDEKLLVFGLRGHLFRSDDAGNTWTQIETNTKEMLTNAIRLEDGTIIISGLGGTILISYDSGHSFSSMDFGSRNGYAALILNTHNELITVGNNGVKIVGNVSTLK